MFETTLTRVAPLLLALSLLALLGVCHHPDDPFESDIFVRNTSHCKLAIVIDGDPEIILDEHDSDWIEDVGRGVHVLEAYDSDTGELVELRQIDLHRHEDYHWHIEGC